MTRPSKKTPTKVARYRAARERGASVREASAEAGIAKSTASRWEQGNGTGQKAPRRAKAHQVDATTAAEVAAVLDAPEPVGLAGLIARSGVIRALLERLKAPLERDEYPAAAYVQIARYADDLDQRIIELTPPIPKDPDQDEQVLAAEAVFLERLAGLIEAAERRTA